MQTRATRYGWVVRVDSGEDLFEALREFAVREDVRAGTLTGIGAVSETELGFFDRGTGSYVRRTFTGDHEVVALVGNFSDLEGRPFPHCHLTIAGRDFVAYGGHLFRAAVSLTCEVHVATDPIAIRRDLRPDLGFNPIELG